MAQAVKDLVLLGDRDPSAFTHRELDAAIQLLPAHIHARWVGTDSAEATQIAQADGVWVVPGSPYRNDSAVYAAITHARTQGQPFLGTCGGFQYVVVEFARNVAGIADAEHGETAPMAESRVVDRLTCSLVGQERTISTVAGTRLGTICGDQPFVGFHWCNFGVASTFLPRLIEHGLVVSAVADDAGVEGVELTEHPFFVATLFQPQVGATKAGALHRLITAFVSAL